MTATKVFLFFLCLAFFQVFSFSQKLEWGTYYGGPLDDQSFAVAVDAARKVFVAGPSGSDTGISTSGTHQPVSGGSANDAFLARFGPCVDPVLDVPNGGYRCTNQPFVLELNFSPSGPYTFTYTIGGVEQTPITTSDSS